MSSKLWLFLIVLTCCGFAEAQYKQNGFSSSAAGFINPPIIKDDFMVNSTSSEYGALQLSPVAAADSNGNTAVAWLDLRNGKYDLYIQFYDSKGVPRGSNQLVNETKMKAAKEPCIAMNNNNECIVVWPENNTSVMYQRFDNSGNKNGHNNSILRNSCSMYSGNSVALNDEGYFMITWIIYNGCNRHDLEGCLISPVGTVVPSGKIGNYITGEGLVDTENFNSLAADNNGNFGLIWIEITNGRQTLAYSIINQNRPFDVVTNFIDDSVSHRNISDPCIAATNDGKFLLAWNSQTFDNNQYYKCVCKIVDVKENTASAIINIGEGANINVTSNKKDNFSIMYFDNTSLVIEKIKSDGSFISKNNLPAFDFAKISRYDKTGFFAAVDNQIGIAYSYYKKGDTDISLFYYKNNILPVTEIKVNDDSFSSWQIKPFVCANNQGGYIVLWTDSRNGGFDLYGKVYDKNNNPVSGDIKINSVSNKPIHEKYACALSDGSFVVGFIHWDSSVYDGIYLQKLSATGEKITENILCLPGLAGYNDLQYQKLLLNADSKDEILVLASVGTQYFNRSTIVRFNKELKTLSGPEDLFRNITYQRPYLRFALSIYKNNKIFLSFAKIEPSNYMSDGMLRGIVFDEKGKAVSDTFLIKQFNKDNNLTIIDNKLSDDINPDYAVIWYEQSDYHILRKYNSTTNEDYFNNVSMYNQFYKPRIVNFNNKKLLFTYYVNGFTAGKFFNDNTNNNESFIFHKLGFIEDDIFDGFNSYSCALAGNKFIYTYQGNQTNGTGTDIIANVQRIDTINFKPEFCFGLTNKDKLHDSYPNPFNSSTKIPFTILAYHKVKITIYDILGREVKVLVNKEMERGIYEVDFNGSNLPSGVYFCRLDAFNSSVKKILLLK